MKETYTTIRQVISVNAGIATLVDGSTVAATPHTLPGMYHVLYSDGLQAFIGPQDVDAFRD